MQTESKNDLGLMDIKNTHQQIKSWAYQLDGIPAIFQQFSVTLLSDFLGCAGGGQRGLTNRASPQTLETKAL